MYETHCRNTNIFQLRWERCAAVKAPCLAAASPGAVCQGGTKSPANPFTGNGCHPSNPFKFDLAKKIKNKKMACMTEARAPIGRGEGEVNDAHAREA